MFTRQKRSLSIFVLGLVLLSACNMPGSGVTAATQLPPEAIYTAAAQTLEVQLTHSAETQASAGQPGSDQPSTDQPAGAPATETPQPSPAPPTDTPTLAFTNTPAFTPTSSIPLISASTATNCRRGPSKVYEPPIGVLRVGVKAEVHGRNDSNTWWYIRNPGDPAGFCWVWGETTEVEGNTAGLPVITPPPPPPTATFTPTVGAAFSASYDNVHACSGSPTAIFKISNTGGAKLESLNLKIEDLTASTTLFGPASSDAPFMGTTGECPPGGDVLNAGKTLYVGGAIGPGNSGHSARATIKLCTANGLDGICVEKKVDFTIP